jgi:hypothetical protein
VQLTEKMAHIIQLGGALRAVAQMRVNLPTKGIR